MEIEVNKDDIVSFFADRRRRRLIAKLIIKKKRIVFFRKLLAGRNQHESQIDDVTDCIITSVDVCSGSR